MLHTCPNGCCSEVDRFRAELAALREEQRVDSEAWDKDIEDWKRDAAQLEQARALLADVLHTYDHAATEIALLHRMNEVRAFLAQPRDGGES